MTHASLASLGVAASAAMCCVTGVASAHDLIGIHLRPAVSNVQVGDVVDVRIMAVREPQGGSSFIGFGEAFRALDLFFSWNPEDLRLLGVNTAGIAAGISSAGFLSPAADYTGTNEATPPADGNGYFFALCLMQPTYPTTAGSLVSTLRFQVLREFASTQVSHIVSVPSTQGIMYTQVLDAALPGYVSTGSLVPAVLTQGATSDPCPADLNGDGSVESFDLSFLLAAWGTVDSPANLIRNEGSPTVDAADLTSLLAAWGPCGN
jgi:hypothetical protein